MHMPDRQPCLFFIRIPLTELAQLWWAPGISFNQHCSTNFSHVQYNLNYMFLL